jgi:arylsulfatase A-like enzyme
MGVLGTNYGRVDASAESLPFAPPPSGSPFEYFYGFLAGEASQYEPHLVRITTVVPPPKTPEQGYHLSEDLADDAISWLRTHKATTASACAPAWRPRPPWTTANGRPSRSTGSSAGCTSPTTDQLRCFSLRTG